MKHAATKAITTAATKTGEHVGKKGGDKIIQMMTKKIGDEKGGEMIEQMLKKKIFLEKSDLMKSLFQQDE